MIGKAREMWGVTTDADVRQGPDTSCPHDNTKSRAKTLCPMEVRGLLVARSRGWGMAIKKEAFSLNEVPSAIRLASHDRCTSPAPLSHEDGAGIETRHDNCKIGPVQPVWKLLLSMSGTVYQPPSVDLRILNVRCCHLSTSIRTDTSACDGSDASGWILQFCGSCPRMDRRFWHGDGDPVARGFLRPPQR